MTTLEPFQPLDVADLGVVGTSVPDDLRLEGEPSTGFIDVAVVGGATVGIWEMTAGSMRDIEADEVFVVLSGEATVELIGEDGRVARTIELRAGSLCRLESGMLTRWHVPTALRKIYVVPDPEPEP
ncbi:cupin domain-containing protein [Microbacterium schleiferi]|uniref:cupin domain-containing protein n=1 Tax=Microbacterium schleiferi TaxID=69362 RepID=UPI001D17295B|nr:cupin domain-containing protein [Microbacterium schleiferi]MCC4266956.1 cupin domain-containing protein [Microbacterium schleiferi]